MKATVTLENLRSAVRDALVALGRGSPIEVLHQIHIEVRDNILTLATTDLDSWVTARVPAEVQKAGSALVQGTTLGDLVTRTKSGPVELKLEGGYVLVSAGKVSAKLATRDVGDYPLREFNEDTEAEWSIGGAELVKVAHRTAWAVSNEDSRPILHNVHWQLAGGRMAVCATSGHVLVRQILRTNGAKGSALVPPKALQAAAKMLGTEECIKVSRHRGWLSFEARGTTYRARLAEGEFPNYEQVIPTTWDRDAWVDRAALLAAVELADVVSHEKTSRVRLLFDDDELVVVGDSAQGEARDVVPVELEGKPIKIMASAQYLREALRRIPTERVRIEMRGEHYQIVFKPEWEDEAPPADGDLLIIVMPQRET